MTTITLDTVPYTYSNGVFNFSEKDVPFATQYKVVNPATGGSMIFEFKESTGPEFDPQTQWIYKNYLGNGETGDLTLIVSNDPIITNRNANNYLTSKLSK